MTDSLTRASLAYAAWRGDEAEVARLLAAGANVHYRDDCALYLAARQGHDAVVARLLAAGADVHARDGVAVKAADFEGHDVVVARLIAAGANKDLVLFAAADNHAVFE
jgi:ankyrin repeat protein